MCYQHYSVLEFSSTTFISLLVVERIIAGMVPVRLRLVEKLYTQPDLYGPFWLSITLILVTAVSGNIAVIRG